MNGTWKYLEAAPVGKTLMSTCRTSIDRKCDQHQVVLYWGLSLPFWLAAVEVLGPIGSQQLSSYSPPPFYRFLKDQRSMWQFGQRPSRVQDLLSRQVILLPLFCVISHARQLRSEKCCAMSFASWILCINPWVSLPEAFASRACNCARLNGEVISTRAR